jgi:SAM-dependent methyltransferase
MRMSCKGGDTIARSSIEAPTFPQFSNSMNLPAGGRSSQDDGMGLYTDWILPHLINLAMRNRDFVPYRERVLSAAEGRVLEIGIGSGLNLPYYGPRVKAIIGLDPSPGLLTMARRAAEDSAVPVELTEGTAEEITLDDRSIDTAIPPGRSARFPKR